MNAPEQLFFQSVKVVGGRQIPIYNVVSGSYSESIELDGPQLLLTLNDSDSTLADDFGLREGALIDVRMGDSGSKPRAAYFASRFAIISSKPDGDHLLLSAIEAGVYAVKQPSVRTMIFHDTPPKAILSALFPGYRLDVPDGVSADRVTYHTPANSRPSIMLRQMAKELGCALWVARGVVCCIPYKQLLTRQIKDIKIRLEYQGSVQKRDAYAIYSYSPIYVASREAREEKRQFMTWDTERGFIISKVNEGCPRVFLPVASPAIIDAAVWRFTNCMQAELSGCGIFSAGLAASVRLNRMSLESVIDESVPLTQVFGRISHIQNPNSYRCVATMGIPEC